MADSPKMDCSALVTRGEVISIRGVGCQGGGGKERGLGQGQDGNLNEDEVLKSSRAEVLHYTASCTEDTHSSHSSVLS